MVARLALNAEVDDAEDDIARDKIISVMRALVYVTSRWNLAKN